MIQPGQSNASLFPVAVGAGELLVVEIVISSGPRQTAWSTLADAGRRWPTLADAGRRWPTAVMDRKIPYLSKGWSLNKILKACFL
jgi:hypothetical protein